MLKNIVHFIANVLQVSDDDIIKSVSFTIGRYLLKVNKSAISIDFVVVINDDSR